MDNPKHFFDLNIILPTLNEEKNIGKILKTLQNLYPDAHITVADDGSKDNTPKLVKNLSTNNPKLCLLDRSNEKVKGLTASVVHAIQITDQKYFTVIDADLQHPPEKIQNILNSLKKNDIVIGIREKVVCAWPIHRKFISRSAIALGNLRLLIAGKRYKDIVSGFFGADTSIVKQVIKIHKPKFELQGYKVLFDILKYIPRKAKVSYVPYEFGLRDKGSSKISNKVMICYLRSIFK